MWPFKRIKRPVQGHATITWCESSRNNNGYENCRMKLLLDVPGIQAIEVAHHELSMGENRWPEPGMRVAVKVDADHPERVDVDWDSVFGERYGGVFGGGAELAGGAIGIDLDLSKGHPDAQGGDPAPDWQQQVAQLNADYAAGKISYEEMAAGVMRATGGA
jgi:hypothetical protein